MESTLAMIFVILSKNDQFVIEKPPFAWKNMQGSLIAKKNLFVFVFWSMFLSMWILLFTVNSEFD